MTIGKPRPAPGMNQQWTADEEEILAATRKAFALTQSSLRLKRWARWSSLVASGMVLSTAVRVGADAALPERATLVQAVATCVAGLVWAAASWYANRAESEKISHAIVGTENIKYVPPEADENAAE